MNTKFTVGQLAVLSNISKQTLLFYDKKGVFKPKYVDENNKYRYYTPDQLEILDSILILKDIGLSLAQIKEFMQNRTTDYAVNQIKFQLKKNKEKIENLKLITKRLQRKIQTIEDYTSNQNCISVINIKTEQYLAIEKVKKPYGLLQLDIAYKKLLNKASEKNYQHHYQIGAILKIESLKNGDYTKSEYGFIPIINADKEISCFIKNAGIYMQGFHTGSYQDIGETYKKIFKEINKQGYNPVGYSFEYCILDSLTAKNKLDYVTEIQIKIEKT